MAAIIEQRVVSEFINGRLQPAMNARLVQIEGLWQHVFLTVAWVLMDQRVPATDWGNAGLVVGPQLRSALQEHCRDTWRIWPDIVEGESLGRAAQRVVEMLTAERPIFSKEVQTRA